jgi:hypothetical protein
MRSQALLLRQARAASAAIPRLPARALVQTVRSAGRIRKQQQQRSDRVLSRPASSDASSPSDAPPHPDFLPAPPANPAAAAASPALPSAPNAEPPSADDGEKARRKTPTTKAASSADPPTLPALPQGLNVLWSPAADGSAPDPDRLPPQEVMDDALANLHVALHPQTQNRSVYASSAHGPVVEPTLGLYCPIEGGDYVVDEAVRELARRTGADVVVLDAVQLAAGEWGAFGEGV